MNGSTEQLQREYSALESMTAPEREEFARMSQEGFMQRYPDVTAAMVEWSLHYFSPVPAAGAAAAAVSPSGEHWCEWYIHQANVCAQNGEPKTMREITVDNLRRAVEFQTTGAGGKTQNTGTSAFPAARERVAEELRRIGDREARVRAAVLRDADDAGVDELRAAGTVWDRAWSAQEA